MCCVNVISLSVILSLIERVLMFVYMYCVSYVWMIYLFNCYRTKKNYITSKSIIVTGNSVLFIYQTGNNITITAAHNEFFYSFGCPFQIFTDQGRNFESKLFRAVCELLQVHKARTVGQWPGGEVQPHPHGRSAVLCRQGTELLEHCDRP